MYHTFRLLSLSHPNNLPSTDINYEPRCAILPSSLLGLNTLPRHLFSNTIQRTLGRTGLLKFCLTLSLLLAMLWTLNRPIIAWLVPQHCSITDPKRVNINTDPCLCYMLCKYTTGKAQSTNYAVLHTHVSAVGSTQRKDMLTASNVYMDVTCMRAE
jgi:hypothetical protein